jgi:hypothetical protein
MYTEKKFTVIIEVKKLQLVFETVNFMFFNQKKTTFIEVFLVEKN